MKPLPLALLALVAACATQVSHPTKTVAEQQIDIDMCTSKANHKYWMDPIAALYNAYDCLEALGYQRVRSGMATQVQNSVNQERREQNKPVLPCRVPCRRP